MGAKTSDEAPVIVQWRDAGCLVLAVDYWTDRVVVYCGEEDHGRGRLWEDGDF